MDYIILLAIFCIFGLPVLCVTLIIVIKILRGPARKAANLDIEETRLIQEMHHSLSRFEERIEALETIVLEHEKKKLKT